MAGRSGAGKTSLLKLLLSEERPTKGRVFFEGKDISKIKRKDLPYLRRKIGAVFQDYKLLSSKTVFENISFVMEAVEASDQEISENIPKILEIVGLSEKQAKFPHELSSGQCQRAAIARALIHRPEVILADEPTGNLDPYNTSEIIELLQRINEFGTTIILSTHSKDIIKKLKKRTIILKDGKIARDDEKGRLIL